MNRENYFLLRLLLFVTVMLQYNLLFSQDTIPRKDTTRIIAIPFPHDFDLRQQFNDPVLIIERRNSNGINSQKPDSLYQSHYASGTLTDLLNENGLIFLKTYGGGSLATTSVRGASASQTPVMWNGLNLQSPTNGNVDLSLLPVILFDNVSLDFGANSSGYGSGAIGGVINTGTNILFGEKNWNVKYVGTGGSFGEINNGIKIAFRNDHFAYDVRAYRQQAKNNFIFHNSTLPGNPLDTLVNGDFLQQGIQAETRLQIKQNYLSARCWLQSSDRGIAPSMFETNAHSRQTDKFFRSLIEWRKICHFFEFTFRSAPLAEYMDFDPGSMQVHSITNAFSVVNECNFSIHEISGFKFDAGISDTWAEANVTQYVPSTKQNRASIYGSVGYDVKNKLFLQVNFREEELNGKFVPPVGAFSADWKVFKWANLKSSIARNYRLPTFNDLYWNPGGNINLKPEDSFSEELTADFHFKFLKEKLTLNYTSTIYNRRTNNWIQWTPGPAFWSPENLLEVWSRGMEQRLKIDYKITKWDFTLIGAYDYVRATNEKAITANDPAIGKQLMYLPADKWNIMFQVSYYKFYIGYLHRFTDLEFTSTDHSSYLPAYSLDQFTIGKRIDYKSSVGDIFFRVKNSADVNYQSIPFRAMPGRNYEIGITIDFNAPIKTIKNKQ